MDGDISDLAPAERSDLAAWVGDRPESVLAIHALATGNGRVWFRGAAAHPEAVLVETALVPGEPMAFGQAHALIELIDETAVFTCVEAAPDLIGQIEPALSQRWGSLRRVTDLVHVLTDPPHSAPPPAGVEVRQLGPEQVADISCASDGLWPEATEMVVEAAGLGRVFVALVDGVAVAQASSFAASERYADISVHVAPDHRRLGLATATARHACRAVQRQQLVPVWGAGAHNTASLGVARRLGFTEAARLHYLVPDER